MKRLLFLAMLAFVSGCKCGGAPPALSAAEIPPSPPSVPSLKADDLMKSYSVEFASISRGSRVSVSAQALTSLSRWVGVDGPPPMLVLVAPSGRLVGVDQGDKKSVYSEMGAPLGDGRPAAWSEGIQLFEDAYRIGIYEHDRAGRRTGNTFDVGEVSWATRVGSAGYDWIASAPGASNPGHENPSYRGTAAKVEVAIVRYQQAGRHMLWKVWSESFAGVGCGAMAPDGRVAIALRSGRFVVLDANQNRPDPEDRQVPVVDVKIDFAAYDMSITETGYAVVADAGSTDISTPRTKAHEAWARHARRADMGHVSGGGPAWWRTAIHHLDAAGKETWRADLPFEILMPPVDAGKGRVYAFGLGFAGIQDGKVMFVTPSTAPMFGTALADGTMAISAGPELRIVDREGKILQKLPTPEHEDITTPPAIGPDGAVWVGTEKAIYVARPERPAAK